MATGFYTCAKCGKSVQPARAASGQMVCPACFAPVLASGTHALPRPQPTARQSGARSGTSSRRSAAPSAHRPSTPGEALSGMSSGSWLPAPDPGPSPDAVDARAMPNRMNPPPPEPAAAPGPAWMRPPGVYYLGAGGLVVVGVVLLVVFIILQKSPPKDAAPKEGGGRNVAAVTPPTTPSDPGTSSTVPPKVVVPAHPEMRVVNLMPLIDPDRDGVAGQWKMTPEGLTSDASQKARVGILYANLPEEYDFRIEYTRKTVEENVSQIFTLHKHRCMWIINGWKGKVSGFQMIGDRPANMNETTVLDIPFGLGQPHVSILKVRSNTVTALLDGKVISTLHSDGSDLHLKPDWDLPDYSLGVASHTGITVFHKIELIENPE